MLRSFLVVFLGLMMVHCSGGNGSSTTEDSPTGSTTNKTGGTTGATTGATTGGTTGATTGGASTTTSMTGVTNSSSTTTGPPLTSMADDSQTNGGPAPDVECGELPSGVVGVPYSTFVHASGGMGQGYSWEFLFNAPAWLSLINDGSESAELAGVPAEAGVYMFSIRVFSNGTEEPGDAPCTLVVAE